VQREGDIENNKLERGVQEVRDDIESRRNGTKGRIGRKD
jgi:hypothetical protein